MHHSILTPLPHNMLVHPSLHACTQAHGPVLGLYGSSANTYLKARGEWQRRPRRLQVMSATCLQVMSATHDGPTPITRRIATTRRAGQGAGLPLPHTSSHLCLSAGVYGLLRVCALVARWTAWGRGEAGVAKRPSQSGSRNNKGA
jgi:hypothetical protein